LKKEMKSAAEKKEDSSCNDFDGKWVNCGSSESVQDQEATKLKDYTRELNKRKKLFERRSAVRNDAVRRLREEARIVDFYGLKVKAANKPMKSADNKHIKSLIEIAGAHQKAANKHIKRAGAHHHRKIAA